MLAMSDLAIGQLAGLTTSILWVVTSMTFAAAGHRIGSTAVNVIRVFCAIVFLGVTHRILSGTWIPDAQFKQVWLLALSGVIGLSVGDQALFTAFVYIGPRLATLIMTTSPLFAIGFGWAFLGEVLSPFSLIGIGITVAGVAWVAFERAPTRPDDEHTNYHHDHRVRGILLAIIGAACQAGGLWLSKAGIGHGWLGEGEHLNPQAATLVRMVFAAAGVLPILAYHRALRYTDHAKRVKAARYGSWKVGLVLTVFGAFSGPFLGVWLSLVACDKAPIGIAQTLLSLTPVFILPVVALTKDERITKRAVAGACFAVIGLAVLFLSEPNSGEDVVDDTPVHVGEPHVTPSEGER